MLDTPRWVYSMPLSEHTSHNVEFEGMPVIGFSSPALSWTEEVPNDHSRQSQHELRAEHRRRRG
jgi:hypothetical protein